MITRMFSLTLTISIIVLSLKNLAFCLSARLMHFHITYPVQSSLRYRHIFINAKNTLKNHDNPPKAAAR